MKNIRYYLTKANFPAEAMEIFEKADIAVCENEAAHLTFENMRNAFLGKISPNGLYEYWAKIGPLEKILPYHRYVLEFLSFIVLLPDLEERYERHGIPKEFFDGVLVDMRCKLYECRAKHHMWGSFVSNWYCGFFTLDRFSIGRLQYEYMTIPEYTPENGRENLSGKPCLNVHIPSSGPLDMNEVDKSINMAKEYYKDRFKDGKTLFRCSSWLFCPEMIERLPDSSNIKKFDRLFEEELTRKELKYESVAERVFGDGNPDDLSTLKTDTFLQKLFYELIKNKTVLHTTSKVFYR